MPNSGERSVRVIAWRGCSEERNRSATVIAADRGWIKGAGSGLGKDRVLQIEISADDLVVGPRNGAIRSNLGNCNSRRKTITVARIEATFISEIDGAITPNSN